MYDVHVCTDMHLHDKCKLNLLLLYYQFSDNCKVLELTIIRYVCHSCLHVHVVHACVYAQYLACTIL